MLIFHVTSALLAALLIAGSASAQAGPGDTNGDGCVDGKDLATVLSAWGCYPAEIDSVTPLQGSVLGGTVITITGTGLAATSVVTVGGAPCTGLTVVSPTEVRATTPPGAVGDSQIVVTTSGGDSNAPVPFSYAMQSVTSIYPTGGYYAGGTPITITGEYLAGITSVRVGGVPATNVVAVDSTRVTAVTPPGSLGTVSITLVGSKGSLTVPGAFTYVDSTTPAWATLVELVPDPAVVTNANLRAAIIATGLPWKVRDNGTGIEMVLIPPGTFDMGCSASNSWPCGSEETPVHAITLTNAFYLGRREVTQAQWEATTGSNPSGFQGLPESPSRPVERVSWNMAQEYLALVGMRLPTEAEWEYAYRAGTMTAFHGSAQQPSGTNDETVVGDIGWYVANSNGRTQPVGSKAPNGFGVYDMSGNVQEWVSDWFSVDFYGSSPATDPAGPSTGLYRVLRGGHWANGVGALRSSFRNYDWPYTQITSYGFRVARNP